MKESQLVLRNKREKDIFKQLKDRPFIHTTMFDPNILSESGMDNELDLVFTTVGWEVFGTSLREGVDF